MLADELADFLSLWLPGLSWNGATRENLAEALRAAATCHPDVYLVFREELPDGVPTDQALIDAFGAEEGDQVIEVRAAARPGELGARRWQVRLAA
jgi:hypothetical protein